MSGTVTFIYKTFVVGGAERLILKMARIIASTGIKTDLICKDIHADQKRKFMEAGVNVKTVDVWEDKNEIQVLLEDCEVVNCVVFSYDDYLKVKSIRHPKKKTILYAIHYMALTMETDKALFWLRKAIMRRVIHAAYKSGDLVCMDEQTVRFTQDYYKEEALLSPLYERIVRICVEIPAADFETVDRWKQGGKINILSIARADFPFKGYLTGLIDSFRNPKVSERFTLDIVSYGDGENLLQQHLNALPEEVRSGICLHGKLVYEEIEPLFQKAQLYVGMGTTILDAASRGIIAIPVQAYTHDVCCDCFFHEDYRVVAVDNGSREKYAELLQYVSGMTREEYLEASRHTIALVQEHYDAHSTSAALLRHFENMEYDRTAVAVWVAENIREAKCMIKSWIK